MEHDASGASWRLWRPHVLAGVAGGLAVPLLQGLAGLSWVQAVAWPAGLLLAGYLVYALRRRASGQPGSADSSAALVETQRLMAAALRRQGELELAFERLRQLPPLPAVMDDLYALAQDFEGRQRLDRAREVYQCMAAHGPGRHDAAGLAQHASQALAAASVSGARAPIGSPAGAAAQGFPSQIGRFRIERELGKGAMGVVYQGVDPASGRAVAIKTLALGAQYEGSALGDARERFFREAETAGRLRHPCIVNIFEAGEAHDLAFIAMELLGGSDLGSFCRAQQQLPPATVASIVARVADALDYAHRQGVVHRDVKPANIMYEPATDIAKVMDFGIARITDSSRTKTGLVLGTPSYMSPEQLAGKKVDGRSDLYSLGVTLFQLLTASLPFRGDSMAELMYNIAHEEPPALLALRPDLPTELAACVALALRKQPEARFQEGRVLATTLRNLFGLASDAAAQPAMPGSVYDASRTPPASLAGSAQMLTADAGVVTSPRV